MAYFSILRAGIAQAWKIVIAEEVATSQLARNSQNVNILNISKNFFSPSKVLLRPAPALVTVRTYSKHAEAQQKKRQKHDHKSDSDYYSVSSSDNELLGDRAESKFWRRKMRTFHKILDVNKDGVISYDDFKLLADRFSNMGHLSDKHKHEFNKLINELWEKLWGEITPYNLVTIERYLEDMHHVLNDRPLKKKAHSFLPFLFRAIDKTREGKISIEDFKLFFACLGLKESDAIMSFRLIDSNDDGKITLKEFVKNGRQFFLTEDEKHISKYFWGPLVEDH